MPVPDFVRLHARARPDAVALASAGGGAEFTYRALDSAIASAVTFLRKAGVTRGERVAALARNCSETVILQLACARAGAILAPLNWRLAPAELCALIEDCDPVLLVGDDMLDCLATSAVPKMAMAEVAAAIAAEAPAPFEAGDADLPSLMLYTSGTSGKPKGVLLTERNLFATAANFAVLGEVGPNSAFLVDSPMFHVIGMVTNVRPTLMMGGRIVVSSGFDPATTLARLGDPDLAISHYFCVPQMAEMLRAAPGFDPDRLRGLKAVFTGGAPHPAARIREWLADGIPIVDGYGMTEAGTVLGMPLDPAIIDRKAGSAGLLGATIERRVAAADGSDCAPGEVGELLLRGPNVCAGYWRNPAETAKAFTPEGFFRTGDLVREDEDGFFTLVDRKKEMFISGGENVYPAEIEAVLAGHPSIAQAAVLGVPDARWGEVGHAFVLLHRGAEPDEQAILAACGERLARYKLPKKIHFVADLPRTGSGKVIKSALRALLGE
ncbi:acyl-CoA synthetase [Sphingomonas deserti]|uniref:3-methylmercaptopropionyl-CoA ligase n=2 Tax=Allosphingosinicella deserti TaxID=2116704 RepID=A0A2P7QWH2_9SPHN|nr:acyl-CoA synthetase [Sphingomonas deserti]